MTSAASRKSLLTWPRARLTGTASLFLWSFVRRLIVRGPRRAPQGRELLSKTAAGVHPGQAADLHRAARTGRAGPDEDAPPAHREGQQQARQRGHAATNGGP